MPATINKSARWPAFIANLESLTDDQLAALMRTDAGRLQLETYLHNTTADDDVSGLRARVMAVSRPSDV